MPGLRPSVWWRADRPDRRLVTQVPGSPQKFLLCFSVGNHVSGIEFRDPALDLREEDRPPAPLTISCSNTVKGERRVAVSVSRICASPRPAPWASRLSKKLV